MVEVPGTVTYAFNEEYISGGNINLDDGSWFRDSDMTLTIGLNDSNGLPFPVNLPIPSEGVEVAWDGATATILDITGLLLVRQALTQQLVSLRLTFDATLPVAGTVLTIMIPSGGTQTVTQTATRNVWAARRDYRGRDFLRVSETESLIGITSTRFIVRAEGPAWAVGDTFTDDKGATQTVQGIGEIGRGRWLELLTLSTG